MQSQNNMNFWLVKSDPDSYSWDKFVIDKRTAWDGVRNYQARNNLKLMEVGDKVLFYESVTTKDVIGIAEVTQTAFQDPTTNDDRWVAVELEADTKFDKPVNLNDIKNVEKLQNIALLKQSRLSVMPLTSDEFHTIVNMGNES